MDVGGGCLTDAHTGDNLDRLEVDDSAASPNPALVAAGEDTATFQVFGYGTGSATLSASAPYNVGDELIVEVGGP